MRRSEIETRTRTAVRRSRSWKKSEVPLDGAALSSKVPRAHRHLVEGASTLPLLPHQLLHLASPWPLLLLLLLLPRRTLPRRHPHHPSLLRRRPRRASNLLRVSLPWTNHADVFYGVLIPLAMFPCGQSWLLKPTKHHRCVVPTRWFCIRIG